MKQKAEMGDWVKITGSWNKNNIGKVVGIIRWLGKRIEYKVLLDKYIKINDYYYADTFYSYQFRVMSDDEVMVERL